ncbi:Steamer duck [Operophtera brumata]|uniref:Steamer duck n=1 Tax=Operophtera brumata TaxID=104452 RepID=A0A0L7KYF9_OPEBR|nr:Steamer duck [Operophtera brumata]
MELADAGFIKHAGRALCHACNARVKADGLQNYMCYKCQLADAWFIKHAGRALCHARNARVKADGLQNYMCYKCQ